MVDQVDLGGFLGGDLRSEETMMNMLAPSEVIGLGAELQVSGATWTLTVGDSSQMQDRNEE